jgi:hypothetical protein
MKYFAKRHENALPLVGRVGWGRGAGGVSRLVRREKILLAGRRRPPPTMHEAALSPGQGCGCPGDTRTSCIPHKGGGFLAALAMLMLTACAATQQPDAVAPLAPGFLLGLWHGFIFPVAWIVSLFVKDVAVYAVPNNGGWYDFGYFLGIVVFGVGARKTQVVTRDVYRGGRVVDSTARRVE